MYLDRKSILGTKPQTKEVPVPEWGGVLLIREPSVATMEVIANLPKDRDPSDSTRAWFILHVIDKNGKQLFTADDWPELHDKSFDVIQRVVSAVIAFSDSDEDDAPKKAENGSKVSTE